MEPIVEGRKKKKLWHCGVSCHRVWHTIRDKTINSCLQTPVVIYGLSRQWLMPKSGWYYVVWTQHKALSSLVTAILKYFLSCSLCYPTGLSRCETASMLPSIMASLGIVPAPGHCVCTDWSVCVRLRTDRQQLLLHSFHMARHGGHKRGLPLTTPWKTRSPLGLDEQNL